MVHTHAISRSRIVLVIILSISLDSRPASNVLVINGISCNEELLQGIDMTKQSKRIIEASYLSHYLILLSTETTRRVLPQWHIYKRVLLLSVVHDTVISKIYFDGNAIGYFTLKSARNQPEKTLNTQTKCHKKKITRHQEKGSIHKYKDSIKQHVTPLWRHIKYTLVRVMKKLLSSNMKCYALRKENRK